MHRSESIWQAQMPISIDSISKKFKQPSRKLARIHRVKLGKKQLHLQLGRIVTRADWTEEIQGLPSAQRRKIPLAQNLIGSHGDAVAQVVAAEVPGLGDFYRKCPVLQP